MVFTKVSCRRKEKHLPKRCKLQPLVCRDHFLQRKQCANISSRRNSVIQLLPQVCSRTVSGWYSPSVNQILNWNMSCIFRILVHCIASRAFTLTYGANVNFIVILLLFLHCRNYTAVRKLAYDQAWWECSNLNIEAYFNVVSCFSQYIS